MFHTVTICLEAVEKSETVENQCCQITFFALKLEQKTRAVPTLYMSSATAVEEVVHAAGPS